MTKMEIKFYNPTDTAKTLKKQIRLFIRDRKWGYKAKEFLNPNLIFSKIIPCIEQKEKQKENREKHIELVKNLIELMTKDKVIPVDYIAERIKKILHNLRQQSYETCGFNARVEWRLVVGLGGTHPEETSMTLHHIYGIPYIPASAVKGVTRHWVDQNSGSEILQDSEFKHIFGTQKEEGKVIFFDAYPSGHIKLSIDIMNPHYPDYYSREKAPADWQNPNPIKFLTVEDTKFCFWLAAKEKELLGKAKVWLKEALKEHGIGARTSLGYGIFGI